MDTNPSINNVMDLGDASVYYFEIRNSQDPLSDALNINKQIDIMQSQENGLSNFEIYIELLKQYPDNPLLLYYLTDDYWLNSTFALTPDLDKVNTNIEMAVEIAKQLTNTYPNCEDFKLLLKKMYKKYDMIKNGLNNNDLDYYRKKSQEKYW